MVGGVVVSPRTGVTGSSRISSNVDGSAGRSSIGVGGSAGY